MTTINTLQFVQIILMVLGFSIWLITGCYKAYKKVKDAKKAKATAAAEKAAAELKAKQALDKLLAYIKETYQTDTKAVELAETATPALEE